jgi:transketolase
VSMPCWELFSAQPEGYRKQVLGTAPRFACEAASGFGWERWIGESSHFVGMQSFGESAPAGELFEHFGITAQALADRVRKSI